MLSVTSLGHLGIYARDMRKMVDFYSNFLGLKVTDVAWPQVVFLSARPEEEHHELALFQAQEGEKTSVQQISFTVESLKDLKSFHQRVKEHDIEVEHTWSHGNAFGCYFRDPEGNMIELYWHTGVDYQQPREHPIDLEASDEELMQTVADLPKGWHHNTEVPVSG